MNLRTFVIYTLSLLASIHAVSLFAAHHEHEHMEMAESSESSAFLSAFSGYYGITTDKAIQLAEAFPEEKMEWSPMEGVFSVRTAILHMASANYFLASQLGAEIPEGVDPKAFVDTVETKGDTVATLKASIDFIKEFAAEFSEEELPQAISLFGHDMNKMGVFMIISGHANEHLGQLIAYARSNEIVPPWSR